jgi:hypothetical protein
MIAPDLRERLAWLREWHGRPQGEWLVTALDMFEPIAPLGAQVLYILQPTLGWMIPRERMNMLAQALETPEGVMAVRHWLRSPQDTDQG